MATKNNGIVITKDVKITRKERIVVEETKTPIVKLEIPESLASLLLMITMHVGGWPDEGCPRHEIDLFRQALRNAGVTERDDVKVGTVPSAGSSPNLAVNKKIEHRT